MSFIVRSLILHHGIELPANGPAPDGTSEILEYRSNVGRTDLEPDPADHLRDGIHVTSIPAGLYLFAQGILEPGTTEQPAIEREKAFRDAAEAVWLESLWQEKPLKNDRILVRILLEDSNTVFQIFREV